LGEKRVILPSIVQIKEGKWLPTKKSFEIATILTYLESIRNKGGGFLFKGSAEYIKFISIFYWPFTLIYRNDTRKYVFFDMMGFFSETFQYHIMPPTDTCVEEISKNQPGSVEVNIFIDILKSCEKILGGFPSVTPYKIQGCLAHEDLMKDLLATFSLIGHNTLGGHILSPRITIEQLKSELETLFKLKVSCQNDIIQLNNILAPVGLTTNKWIEYLTNQQIQVREDFDKKIAEIRPDVEAKVRDYQQKLNFELHSIEMSTAPMISTLESQISRLRMEEEMYKKQEETYKKINPAAAEGARKMKDNTKKIRQKTEDQLKKVIENKNRQTKMITDEYNKLIEKEWERIRSLERERDGIFNLLEHMKTEISRLVNSLQDKISKLVRSKTSTIASIDEVGARIPSEIEEQFGECFHLLMPLIIACLEGEKSRYVILPPLVVKEKGILQITKGLFGSIALPLEPVTERFEKIAKKRFEEMLKTDTNLEKEISTMGPVYDILHLQETKELLTEGLTELRNLGLINDKQFQQMASIYMKR
jgi:DNA anti-recombination protein RmuC